jgi:branched-chain amino acid transport system substrate-binding protein
VNKTLAVGNLVATGAMLTALSVPALAQQKSITISFVSTFSGPPARIGNDMRNSLELALDHLGPKLGSLPIQVICEDDQKSPEVGRQKIEKLIEPDHLDFTVSGPSDESVVAA